MDLTIFAILTQDGIASGAIAVCGFGRRGSDKAMFELDPLGKAVR